MRPVQPDSIRQRVRMILATFDGEFTGADVFAAMKSPLKKSNIQASIAYWADKGLIRRVRREDRAPRRIIYTYAGDKDGTQT